MRLAYQKVNPSGIPASEYTELEYLESSGTQYIDTGVKGKSGIDFDYKIQFTSQPSGTSIGGEYNVNNSLYLGVVRTNGKLAYHYKSTTEPVETIAVTTETDYTITGHMFPSSQYVIINGTRYEIGTISGSFTSSYNMYLFGNNYNNTISTPSSIKLYYCKLYDNGTLIRDFIPAKRKSDNVIGMYDKVNGVFYTNKGSGTFTAGNAVEKVAKPLIAYSNQTLRFIETGA